MTKMDQGLQRYVYVGLGGNVGDVRATFCQAAERMGGLGLEVVSRSGLYCTKAWGVVDQPDFLNAVAKCRTMLQPEAVLLTLNRVEQELGRDRAKETRWGPRSLDLDYLLDADYLALEIPNLTLPHPRIMERAFVLVPLADVAPDLFGPVASPEVVFVGGW